MVRAGNRICEKPGNQGTPLLVRPVPEDGSQPICTENRNMSRIPNQNAGKVINSTAVDFEIRSKYPPGRRAAAIPAGTPVTIANKAAAPPSINVLGIRSNTTAIASCR